MFDTCTDKESLQQTTANSKTLDQKKKKEI